MFKKESSDEKALRAWKTRTKAFPYLMLSPYMVIYAVFMLFPLLYTLVLSLTNWSVGAEVSFIGLKNYIQVLADERYLKSLGNILIFVIGVVPIEILVGLIIATVLHSKLMPAKGAFRTAVFLPYLLIPAAAGVIFNEFFARKTGIVNMILTSLGLIEENIYWLGRPWPARIMVILILLWKYCGYTSIFFTAGISNISPDVYEAAELDGVNPVQKMFRITLPLLKPVFKFVALTTTINTIQLFDELNIMFSTQNRGALTGGPSNSVLTPIWMLYDTAFGSVQRYGYAAAIAVVTFAVIALISWLINSVIGKERK